MKILIILLGLLIVNVNSNVQASKKVSDSTCRGGICIEDGEIDLTTDDINKLKKILSEDEHPDLKYQVVTIENIIIGSVYLLSASKPDYYGIQIVLSKEKEKWVVLKKVKSIY
ncbi:MAG: hypothetical protein L3J53_06825 [Proteobacteria bacterium]|nr:hypothetical protein [Pseudomonadota bacterium]